MGELTPVLYPPGTAVNIFNRGQVQGEQTNRMEKHHLVMSWKERRLFMWPSHRYKCESLFSSRGMKIVK